MDNEEYLSALKKGQKSYRESISRGEYPYLLVLDQMIPADRIYSGKELGLLQIPMDFIVGTRTEGRTKSFAKNFMPIADPKSEFQRKWTNLCESHLEEGIRDPIKVYEYLNRYYVEEGNKRVSVLKYFGAVNVPAYVYRIMPEKNDSPEVTIYYELLDFYKFSKVNVIEFTKPGSYKELQDLLGKGEDEFWTEEETRHLRSVYFSFEKVFRKIGGDYLRLTAGDAFLAYLRIYGYESLDSFSEADLKKTLRKMWTEVRLQEEEQPLDIVSDPEPTKKKLLNVLLGTKKLQIAFLYRQTPETLGWSSEHELARLQVQKLFGDKIETIAYSEVTEKNTEAVIEEAIRDGATVIFATAVGMLKGCLRAAALHPEVQILNCSVNVPHNLIRTYFPRTYEAKFISGAIAGSLCENKKVGYICQYPVYGRIAEINAFARGVQLVNPEAKVYLEWSAVCGSISTAIERMRANDVKWVSMRDHIVTDNRDENHLGLEYLGEDGLVPMALPHWNWSVYYERIIESILNGTFQEEAKTPKSLNYYWGMSAGVVEMIYSSKLPKATRYLGELLSRAIIHDDCRPFYDPAISEDGKVQWNTIDQSLSFEEIITMDYLEENVVGSIPVYEELNERARDMVDFVGISKSRKPNVSTAQNVNKTEEE